MPRATPGGSPLSQSLEEELASLAGESTLRITTRGRRTGRPHSVPIWFSVADGAVLFGTLNDQRDWVRNARHDPEVELAVGSLRLRGRFRDVSGVPAELEVVRRAIAGKYWIARLLSWVGVWQKFGFRVEDLRPVDSPARARVEP